MPGKEYFRRRVALKNAYVVQPSTGAQNGTGPRLGFDKKWNSAETGLLTEL